MLWLLLIALVLLLIWAALRWLPAGSEGRMPLPYVIALIPFLWVPALICTILAGMLGEWIVFGLALVETLVLACDSVPYWRCCLPFEWMESLFIPVHASITDNKSSTTESSVATINNDLAGNPLARFTVMTLNCRYGRANAEDIITAVRTRCVAVLALQELTPELVADLELNGLSLLLPYRQLGKDKPTDNGGFNGVWTRFEPITSQVSAVDIPAADVPSFTVAFPQPIPAYEFDDANNSIASADSIGSINSVDAANSASTASSANESANKTDFSCNVTSSEPLSDTRTVVVTFTSAHTKSPMRGCRQWSQGIIGLTDLIRPQQGDTSTFCYDTVVLGDLNSALDHPSFRTLLTAGFRDTNLTVAQGAVPTFPSWMPWPRIVLDHVLCTSRVTPTHVEAFAIEGTDHLALTATLVVHG